MLSVVIIGRNEGAWLQRTVENLEATLPSRSEIVVVDDDSTDGSAAFLAHRKPRVRLLRTPGVGGARARKFGGRKASGGILLFADAHLGLPRSWCEPLLQCRADS